MIRRHKSIQMGMLATTQKQNAPQTMEETMMGAENRARRAKDALGAPLGMGLESGMFRVSGRLFDVCCCALWDGNVCRFGWYYIVHILFFAPSALFSTPNSCGPPVFFLLWF